MCTVKVYESKGRECVTPYWPILVNLFLLPCTALDLIEHQHVERGSGETGHYSMALWNAMIDYSCMKYVSSYYRDLTVMARVFQRPVLVERSRDDRL